jgi:hypothetical protein
MLCCCELSKVAMDDPCEFYRRALSLEESINENFSAVFSMWMGCDVLVDAVL